MALKTNPALSFRSSDRELEKSFDRVKNQALYWVFEGDPVGPWYEAALPGREAFCMRDVSHQCFGAEMLGLGAQNLNMIQKFVRAISDERDWCSYWEIDKFDRPCPVDYASDHDFWYNLPANFDLLDAIKRLYFVTGNEAYLRDPAIRYFRAQTMEAYIARWDRDGDGIPDRQIEEGRRGLCSYDESNDAGTYLKVGSDLIAVMIRAYESDAVLSNLCGNREQSRIYQRRAQELKRLLNDDLYREDKGYAFGIGADGSALYQDDEQFRSLLYYDAVPAQRAIPLLNRMESKIETAQIEEFSHFPEILWRYGRAESALTAFRRLTSADLPRREYPEASYAAIGALTSGLMGISFDAPAHMISTRPAMPGIEWAELRHIPFLSGEVHILHLDCESELENATKEPVRWVFKGGEALVAPGERRSVKISM